ncbi:uncharacterized protein PAC_18563 [Phialocephala subalpina]|uniref:Major facilitator superfamily (MFS) profile domain-containing protein n=1 Tax=Phialocephala subalpina TaxID=576137 RepID=A0A1L7XUF5_9HELO|nr:uncharacterized protein PAC_18563 [Phialocephala subalpina]
MAAVQILVGRVIHGIANGPLAATTPIYLQESSVVGKLRTVDTMIMVLWGIGGISVATCLILVYGCPDSPRWLLASGREGEADNAIKRPIDCDETDGRFIQVKGDILTSIALEREQTKRLTLKVLFTGDGSPTKNLRRIWISILINIAGPFFGAQLITFYGQALLQGVGIQGDQVTLALAAINTAIPIGMALSFVILPLIGRRLMLCWGGTALTTLMCIYTGLANNKNPSKSTQWGSVVVLILFNIINGASWIWLAFLYAVEILPLQYRSQVQAGSNLVFWFVAFLAVYFGGQAASNPKVGALIYIWFCLGRAKDFTLEEIDLLWADDVFRNTRNDSDILHQATPDTDEGFSKAKLKVRCLQLWVTR